MGQYDTVIGTLLVGIFFNTFLYGFVMFQFAAYYRTKFNDGPIIKCMVLFLFILDTFHSISAIYMAWYYTVTNYDNPAVFELGVWPYQTTPICTALAALVTQVYLGFRIWRSTESKILYGVVILTAIPSFVLGMVCGIEALVIDRLYELPRNTTQVIAWLSMQAVVDAFITVTLITIFSRWRGGFHKTDTVLHRLVRGAIQTGLFAGIFSIGNLITFAVLPNTNFYGMFAIPIGRIYTNTLMDTLLTRETIQTETNLTVHSWTVPSGPMFYLSGDSSQSSPTTQSTSIQVQARWTTQEPSEEPSNKHPKGKIGLLAVV